MKKFLVIIILAVLCYGAYVYNDIKVVLPTKKYETEIRQIKRNVYYKDFDKEETSDRYLEENLVYLGIKGDSSVAKNINTAINNDIAFCDINPFNHYSVCGEPEFLEELEKEDKKNKEKIKKGLYKVQYEVVTKAELDKQEEESGISEDDDLSEGFMEAEDTDVDLFTDKLFVYNIWVANNGGGSYISYETFNYLFTIKDGKATKIDSKSVFGSHKKEILNKLADKINEEKKKIKEECLEEYGEIEEYTFDYFITQPITLNDLEYYEDLGTYSISPDGI
ncbi:MAG: hypothetical protein KBT47_01625, partial [Armatimonadetes bacterium]|nr:hypothetical protein [Candidatus Hippobium faecium]